MGGLLGKIASIATGDLAGTIMGVVEKYFPPDMSPADKTKAQQELAAIEAEREKATNEAIAEAENAINERIKIYEGTASDLKGIPFLGPLMLFFRGMQRILWGYASLYLDYMWFTEWTSLSQKQEAALIVINILVLGFLFGERAVKNVAPLITEMFKARVS